MMIIGRVSFKAILKLLVPLFILVGILFFIGWKVPKDKLPPVLDRLPTQVGRVLSFVNENKQNKFVITDKNRQVVNSQIAIANGHFFPKMPGSSIQRDYLAEAYSDFIFAIIIEEMGILGGIFVIALYLILLFRAGMITYKCEQTFPALLVIGLTLMIVTQAFASMAVAVHLGPVTGQPLPLISRGGTSILVTCAYFGMILSVTRYMQNTKEENSEKNTAVETKEGTEPNK
jgi:cell division protein FtsW